MYNDFRCFEDLPKRFDFMRLKHSNVPIYSLEDVKTLYIIMTLLYFGGSFSTAAEFLEISRKTVKKYYFSNEHLYYRISPEELMLFFHKSDWGPVQETLDGMIK